MPLRRATALFVASAAPFCLVFIWLERVQGRMGIENGPMENFQAICLFLGALLLALASLRSGTRAPRVFLGSLALAYASVLVLEVDTRPLGVRWLKVLFNGPVRDIWLVFLWLAAGFFLLRLRHAVWRHSLSWLRTMAGRLFTFAAGFWVLGSLIDKVYHGTDKLFAEELCEVAGAWLLLLTAWFSFRAHENRQTQESNPDARKDGRSSPA